MDGGYPQSLIENLPSEIKFTKGSLNSKNKTTRRKKKISFLIFNIAFPDTIPTLSVYYKGSLNNKNGILYKTNHNFNKYLKNHQSCPYKKGKSLKDMLVRAKKKKVNKGFTG